VSSETWDVMYNDDDDGDDDDVEEEEEDMTMKIMMTMFL